MNILHCIGRSKRYSFCLIHKRLIAKGSLTTDNDFQQLKNTLSKETGAESEFEYDTESMEKKSLLDTLENINRKDKFYEKNKIPLNSEKSIAYNFLSLLDINIGNIRNTTDMDIKLWVELSQEKNRLKELPEVPINLTSLKLDQYIENLSRLQSRSNDPMNQFISNSFLEILRSNLLTSVESYNLIIKYFGYKYDFKKVRDVFVRMVSNKIAPNINTFNCMLYPLISTHSKYKHMLYNLYLDRMKVFKIKPSLTTWYITFNFLKEEKELIYKNMKLLNLPTDEIKDNIIQYELANEVLTVDKIEVLLDQKNLKMDDKLLNTFVKNFLENNDPMSCFNLLDEYFVKRKILKKIPANVINNIVKYFAIDRKEVYFAIATINYFYDHYNLNYKSFKCYALLAEGMKHVPNFENWSLVTRRFYFDSYVRIGQSMLSQGKVMELEAKARNYGIVDFKIDSLTTTELEETSNEMGYLVWDGEPQFNAEQLEKRFKKAARFFGGRIESINK